MNTATAGESAARLLADYRPGDFFLATARRSLLGSGATATISDVDETRVADQVSSSLSVEATPIAMGVLPFTSTPETPAWVVLPETARFGGPPHSTPERGDRRQITPPTHVRSVPEPADHIATVQRVISELGERDLRKAVLARALDLEFDVPVSPESLLYNLVRDNPLGYTFAANLPAASTLVGSSPELLLSRRGNQVVSHPHAGSLPRSTDPVVDVENGKALLASRKDHTEHAVLTEAVAETLRPYCRSLEVPSVPELVSTPTMWHLRTTITGELIDHDASSLHLATALHPTPAICGTPTESARRLANELEPFDRGYYAGAIGWVDAEGDGEWAVSIRCAEATERTLRLYAGGGIMPDSDPQAELEETSAKFATLLAAMGLPREWLAED